MLVWRWTFEVQPYDDTGLWMVKAQSKSSGEVEYSLWRYRCCHRHVGQNNNTCHLLLPGDAGIAPVASVRIILHCKPKKKSPKRFCHIFYKIRSFLIKFGIYYPEQICRAEINVFYLTWIMSVDYLVKLSIRILQVNGSWNCNRKTHQNVLSYPLQNESDSNKVWYIFSWLNLP